MTQVNKMGPNRTGMDTSPIDGKAMVEGAQTLTKTTPLPRKRMADFRRSATDEGGSIGSVPVPGTFKGALSAGKKKIQGHNPELLINKLGQRLAFERAGTRLYDALIMKCNAAMDSATAQIVSIDKLRHFRDEEHEHMLLVGAVISDLGADPTAMTPDANVSALASLGLPKVIGEPRTSVLQCLEAIQVAELTDNAAWADLRELCLTMGLDEIADKFKKPISQEQVHEEVLADWIKQLIIYQSSH